MITFVELSSIHLPFLDFLERVEEKVFWDAKKIGECLQEADYFGWVIFKNNSLLGYVLLKRLYDEAHVMHLALHHDHRRQGYGLQLLNYVVSQLPGLKLFSCFLEVQENNLPAKALYKKLGFIEIGRRKNYYQQTSGNGDAIVMQLNIPIDSNNR